MNTIAMLIQYDGSGYHGWQRQLNGKSVQEVVERPLSKLLRHKVNLIASGRTDAGVHAISQCVSFQCHLNMPIENLAYALNAQMPNDVVILRMWEAESSFHARYDAVAKTYLYKLYNGPQKDPFKNKYCLYVPIDLNEMAIRKAMTFFVGTHDFVAFMATGSAIRSTVRTIFQFDLVRSEEEWHFQITGDGFLYHMVRIIVGLLIEVGKNKVLPEEIPDIIKSGNRSKAKWTAPANGLYLKEVMYNRK